MRYFHLTGKPFKYSKRWTRFLARRFSHFGVRSVVCECVSKNPTWLKILNYENYEPLNTRRIVKLRKSNKTILRIPDGLRQACYPRSPRQACSPVLTDGCSPRSPRQNGGAHRHRWDSSNTHKELILACKRSWATWCRVEDIVASVFLKNPPLTANANS